MHKLSGDHNDEVQENGLNWDPFFEHARELSKTDEPAVTTILEITTAMEPITSQPNN